MSTDADRPAGIRIARIGGVPVYIGPSWLILAVIIMVLLALVRSCAACDPQRENCSSSGSTWRSGGGSYGGYSSGGSHK